MKQRVRLSLFQLSGPRPIKGILVPELFGPLKMQLRRNVCERADSFHTVPCKGRKES